MTPVCPSVGRSVGMIVCCSVCHIRAGSCTSMLLSEHLFYTTQLLMIEGDGAKACFGFVTIMVLVYFAVNNSTIIERPVR